MLRILKPLKCLLIALFVRAARGLIKLGIDALDLFELSGTGFVIKFLLQLFGCGCVGFELAHLTHRARRFALSSHLDQTENTYKCRAANAAE